MGEAAAARSLIASGCDVIAQHCDSINPQIEAQKAHVWGIGYNSDMSGEAPAAVIVSVLWNWGTYYTALTRSVLDGSFTAEPYFGSLAEGMVTLSPLSPQLAAVGTMEEIAAERERIIRGGFDVFEGALETNDGRIIGEAGKRLSSDEIRNGIDWYYRNVIEIK
jgi:basic membrane protein A